MECLTNLVSIRNIGTVAPTPFFWLDDIEGMDKSAIELLSKNLLTSGKSFGIEIIEAASRFLITDIETLIPKGYGIKSSLNSFCNTCTYTSLTSSSTKTGVIVRNVSTSKNAYLSLDSLKVMTGSTGTFTIVLDDDIEPKTIEATFTSGVEKIITNINFKTSSKYIKIYFAEGDDPILVKALSCPTTKSCGCSGKKADSSTDITVKGLLSDAEFTTQYGFVPCASVVCSMDNILCNIVNQQPRLFALALLYRSAAKYFSETPVTLRNNRNASFDEEEKLSLADRYTALYYERLRGSANVKGISDNMAAALNNLNDACVSCERKTSTAWAVG
jgi:hypothetical protein